MGIMLNHAVDGSINKFRNHIWWVGNISVEYKNRYNTENDTYRKIYISNTLVGEASDNTADQIKTLEVNNLNITDFTIKVQMSQLKVQIQITM